MVDYELLRVEVVDLSVQVWSGAGYCFILHGLIMSFNC